MNKLNVCIIFGGQSTEHDISRKSVTSVINNLNKDKYDISWIHYTHLENWYKKLGYKTVLKWNSDGIVMEKQHEE